LVQIKYIKVYLIIYHNVSMVNLQEKSQVKRCIKIHFLKLQRKKRKKRKRKSDFFGPINKYYFYNLILSIHNVIPTLFGYLNLLIYNYFLVELTKEKSKKKLIRMSKTNYN
jgi:hypothetical protein